MAESTLGSPLAAPDLGQGRNEPTPSAAQNRERRNRRRSRKDYIAQTFPQTDGALSDTVPNNHTAPPRATPKPSHRQSAAPALSTHTGSMGAVNGLPPRPISVGGYMHPETPAKEQAYAGPTFQASPAPSSLPVPRFFSKSVPNAGGQPSLQARMEGKKTPEQSPVQLDSSPGTDVVEPVPRDAVQSPLDMFFKADKAEKQKSRSGSNLLLSPDTAVRRVPTTEPRNIFQQSGRGIFLQELDGDNGDVPSPRTIPPNNRPLLGDRARSSPGVVPQVSEDDEQREAYTKSLKDLLFNSVNVPSASLSTTPQPHRYSEADAYAFNTPSPVHRPTSGSPTPASFANQQNQYALHYGNRNLSPMFKASRAETPTRPSNLRQEVANEHPMYTNNPQQFRRQATPNGHTNPFSREHVDQHNPAARPPSQFPFTNALAGNPPAYPGPVPAQRGMQVAGALGPGEAPRTGGSARDLRGMEDDLRKMLNLDVLG